MTQQKLSDRLLMTQQHCDEYGYPNGYWSVQVEDVRALEAELEAVKAMRDEFRAQIGSMQALLFREQDKNKAIRLATLRECFKLANCHTGPVASRAIQALIDAEVYK